MAGPRLCDTAVGAWRKHSVKVTEPDGAEQVLDADVVLIATGASPRVLPDARARRRPDPDLAPALRPDRAARPPDRGRLGRDGRGIRQRLHRAGRDGDGGGQPRPDPAARGLRCGRGAGGGVRRARRDAGQERPRGLGDAHRRRCRGQHDRRPQRRGQPRADHGRVGAQHVRSRASSASVSNSAAAATSPSTGFRGLRCPAIYAAGDCTGLLLLASVAAMQGRIAMYHALGEGVTPIRLRTVAAAVFTRPEIAAVGVPSPRSTTARFRHAR